MRNINEIFADALNGALEDAEWGSKAKLAKGAKISASRLTDILSMRRNADEETRRKIAEVLGYKYDDFLAIGVEMGKGTKFNDACELVIKPIEESQPEVQEKAVHPPAALPFVALAECGIVGFEKKISNNITTSVSPLAIGSNGFVVMAVGDSMLPALIAPQQLCYCDPEQSPLRGDAVYVETKDNLATIKVFIGYGPENGAPENFLRVKGWLDPEINGDKKYFYKDINMDHIVTIATVIYVKRRL